MKKDRILKEIKWIENAAITGTNATKTEKYLLALVRLKSLELKMMAEEHEARMKAYEEKHRKR